MNILFYDLLKRGSLATESAHISEVLSNLSKLGHNIMFVRAVHLVDERRTYLNQQLSLWKRTKSNLHPPWLFHQLRGEIMILKVFLREILIFIMAFIVIARRKEGFDVIYRRHNLINSEYFLAKLFKIPSVKEVNGIVSDEVKITKRGDNTSLRIIDIIERFNMSKADKIIVVAPKLKEVLHNDYHVPNDRIVVVRNGANIELFKPNDVTKARDELNLDKSSNYICFVGSLVQWQGVEYLVQSAPSVLKDIPNVKFLIVGDGVMKEELVEMVKELNLADKFIFTGAVPHSESPQYINASDVCVVYKKPLRSGYSPLKLSEYMACGKPVIASRVAGFEILEENSAGILVEPENPEELSKAIIKLLKNEKLREEMGRNGREYVVKYHSWESVARDVAEVCESVVREHKNKRR